MSAWIFTSVTLLNLRTIFRIYSLMKDWFFTISETVLKQWILSEK